VTVLPVEAARATASAFAVYFELGQPRRGGASDRRLRGSGTGPHPRPIANRSARRWPPSPPRRHLRADGSAPRTLRIELVLTAILLGVDIA